LERNEEIKIDDKIRQKLITLSCSTIDRLLLPSRCRYQLKGRSTTKPGTLLRQAIPIRTFADWNEKQRAVIMLVVVMLTYIRRETEAELHRYNLAESTI
jgi:hypothetical protein